MIPAIVLAAVVSTPIADRVPAPMDSLRVNGSLGQVHRGVTFAQDFETFDLGSGIQNGWTGFFGAPSDGFNIVDSGIPGFGSRTGRHNSDASGFSGFEASSPVFTAQTGGLYADLILNPASTASLYQMVTVGNANTFNTRINFEADGTIRALQVDGGAGVFVNTTGSWTPGTLTRVGVVVPGDGTMQVVQDGVVIFSGHDIPFALGNASTGIQQFRVWAANATGSAGAHVLFDNINNVVPAPGATALLGLGLLSAARRRRR